VTKRGGGGGKGAAQLGELAGFKDPSVDLGNGFGVRTGGGGRRTGCGCGRWWRHWEGQAVVVK
jgi:hypothetical protein